MEGGKGAGGGPYFLKYSRLLSPSLLSLLAQVSVIKIQNGTSQLYWSLHFVKNRRVGGTEQEHLSRTPKVNRDRVKSPCGWVAIMC